MAIVPVLTVALTLAAGGHPVDPADLKIVNGVPLDVAAVAAGGYWKSGSAEGRYRIVVVDEGWEHVHSKIYAQWIEEVQANRSKRIVRTVPIELSGDGFWSVGSPEFLPPDPVATQVRIDAADSMSDATARFFVTLQSDGKYEVKRSKK